MELYALAATMRSAAYCQSTVLSAPGLKAISVSGLSEVLVDV